MLTNAPKGTKDLLPSQAYKWHYVEKKFAEICKNYGFKEIRTPMFEHTEVFARGIGDTTDVVQKEMYTFNDHGNRSITLKPEGTSGAVRAFIEHKQYAEVQPTKYYYNTDCFRYEKPQSGRLRHFHQFGIEVFGTPNMLADSEVICLANDFLNELGIKEIELRINSVGCPECRKNHREALKAFLEPHYDELCSTCKDRYSRNPMRILDCKSEICQSIVKDAPRMLDYLCDDCKNAFEELKRNLTSMGIDYKVDPNIVRGLDYYTKTAFEFVTTSIGAQGTVCGGGRYDHLIEELGGPPIPGVGFGLGIERLLLLMEACNASFPDDDNTDVFIAVMGERAKAFGLKLCREFRQKGIAAEMDTLARNIKGQFKYADRLNAKYTLVIGENELEKGVVSIKDMTKSQQREIKIEDIFKEIIK
ncbi:MAG: histidine--tRNA ligase [Clostridiales bacterium]|nr:histidine--tRNA ligase [Bacillota bacterium]MEE0517600.1 histidine--tRNA ligase [Anaerovoracaceae bacterium]PWL94693.1 MAG: histidine--tRNA ligase [Clostridiales bacterium]